MPYLNSTDNAVTNYTQTLTAADDYMYSLQHAKDLHLASLPKQAEPEVTYDVNQFGIGTLRMQSEEVPVMNGSENDRYLADTTDIDLGKESEEPLMQKAFNAAPESVQKLVTPIIDPFFNNPIVSGATIGLQETFNGTMNLLRDVNNAMHPDNQFTEDEWLQMPELLERDANSPTQGIVSGLTQFVGVYSGLGKLRNLDDAASGGKKLLDDMLRGGLADAAFDPEDGNLSTFLNSLDEDQEMLGVPVGKFKGPLTEYLGAPIEDDAEAFERLQFRLKSMIEGAGLGLGAHAAIKMTAMGMTALKGMKQWMLETDPESYKKVIAQSTAVSASTLEKTTLAELAKQNPSTTPKVPVNNVFLNDRAAIPKEKRVDIEDSEIPELPLLDIDVSKIVPTQKTISINNLEDVAKAKKIPESDEVLLVEDNGLFYVMDGHHRVANKILNADTSVQARVIKKDSAAPAAFVVAKTESENNQTTANFIKSFEGYRDEGYYATDAEKKAGIVTAGYGSTRRVAKGEKITKEQAEQYLQEDIAVAEKAVDSLVKVDLTPNEKAAVVSLVFNVGQGNFKKSKALKALNNGDIETFIKEAFDSKAGFVRSGGKVLKGLVKRRKAEQELFMRGTA